MHLFFCKKNHIRDHIRDAKLRYFNILQLNFPPLKEAYYCIIVTFTL